jgi:hypothetical protein
MELDFALAHLSDPEWLRRMRSMELKPLTCELVATGHSLSILKHPGGKPFLATFRIDGDVWHRIAEYCRDHRVVFVNLNRVQAQRLEAAQADLGLM